MALSKTGKMTIKPNKISYRILKWMQNNPNQLKKTTGQQIAAKVASLDDETSGEVGIAQALSKMIKCNVVYRDKYDKSVYSDFRINYWHKSIPADILADAPAEVKRAMAKTIDDMQPNQYMDDEGCVVTPNAVEKTEDPFSEDGTTPTVEESVEKMEKDYGIGMVFAEDTASVFEQPTTQEVSVPVEVKKDGKQITVNLSLTINL
jgi:hypothetical protein